MQKFTNFADLANARIELADDRSDVTAAYDGAFLEASDMAKLSVVDEPMAAEMPEPDMARRAVEMAIGTIFDVLKDTRMEEFAQQLAWGISGRKDAPVVVWLNGGPGASSLLGFYDELGPFGIDAELQIVPRNVSWARDCHLIAIDNPLGVGYSHTQKLERMATNQSVVGADLYEAVRQFFELFPAHFLGLCDCSRLFQLLCGCFCLCAPLTLHLLEAVG